VADEVIAGRYRLLEPLGRGAMSSVWLAEDSELSRRVAVKILGPRADPARFQREARAVAALSDPHICALYDYGDAGGRAFMVLEYLPGGSLEDRLRDGRPLPDDETERLATEIAAGLAHAHDRGLVHRDLKPANVLFDAEDRAKIADFGIATMSDAHTLTEAGAVLGTAAYISPEQAAGIPAGPASDVYSFAVIVFRMLTGRLPFVSTNAMELVRMHRDAPPPRVASVRATVPARLGALVDAALAKDPGARPADGAALLDALRGTERPTVSARAVTAGETATQILAPPPRRRRLVPLAALALALLAAGIAAAVLATNRDSGGGGGTPVSTLTLPSVPTASTASVTSVPTTTPTTHPATGTTTGPTTTRARSTTAATTTVPTTTAPATTAPATTAPATSTARSTSTSTTAPATTAPATTAPPPTTTEPLPTTTDTTVTVTVPTTTVP
jgi:serine/threonine protein kinase